MLLSLLAFLQVQAKEDILPQVFMSRDSFTILGLWVLGLAVSI